MYFREQCNADKTRNSFKWFMENVAYDLPKYYPRPHKNVIWGEVSAPINIAVFKERFSTPML